MHKKCLITLKHQLVRNRLVKTAKKIIKENLSLRKLPTSLYIYVVEDITYTNPFKEKI